MYDLGGLRALVTGGTRGIGWAIAQALAENGVRVALGGVSSPEVVETRARELRESHGVDTIPLCFDVLDSKSVHMAYRTVLQEFGGLDILVNNAGVVGDAIIGMITSSAAERTIMVNLHGAILNLQAAARLMERGEGGAIVNVSSAVGVQGHSGQSVYAASKAGVIGLTLAAAKELGAKNIRVNAVAPGFIETDMTDGLADEQASLVVDNTPLGRFGQAGEVANAVIFLVSPMASFITGTVVGVDGGLVLN